MVTRIVASCFVAIVCSMVLAGDAPTDAVPDEPIYADADEIRLLLQILDSPDLAERNAAFNRLLAVGRTVLPHLEERLRLRAGDAYVDLLKGLAVLPEAPVAAAEPEPEDAQGSANPDEVAKYLVDKYVSAKDMYDSGQFERCRSLVEGILSIEPSCSMRADLKKLKVACDERIAEASLIKPSVTSRQDAYRTKDRIDLTFRLDDLTPGPIDLDFTGTLSGLSRAPKNGQNFLHAEITITEYSPYGDSRSWNRTQTWELKENAHLAPAAPWLFPVALDISADEDGARRYRTYTIDTELRPYLLRTPQGDQRARRIQFPRIEIGVFPVEEDVEVLRARGLDLLSKALDGAEANTVFLLCLLLTEEDKAKAVDMLMGALGHPRASDADKQLVITCLRQITRLPLENSDEAWLGWYREKDRGANGKPK